MLLLLVMPLMPPFPAMSLFLLMLPFPPVPLMPSFPAWRLPWRIMGRMHCQRRLYHRLSLWRCQFLSLPRALRLFNLHRLPSSAPAAARRLCREGDSARNAARRCCSNPQWRNPAASLWLRSSRFQRPKSCRLPLPSLCQFNSLCQSSNPSQSNLCRSSLRQSSKLCQSNLFQPNQFQPLPSLRARQGYFSPVCGRGSSAPSRLRGAMHPMPFSGASAGFPSS